MTKAQTTWDTMTPRQRLAAVNIDIMDHIDFSILSGLVTMGEIHVVPDLPTAGTNGVDVFYGEAFVMTLNRKQLRFVQLHETMHKSLRHCSEYTDICEKYPELSNVAMDYVVNAFIEQTDPEHKFMEFPDAPEPLLDPKYYNKAFVDILQDLLRNPPPPPPRSMANQKTVNGGMDKTSNTVMVVFLSHSMNTYLHPRGSTKTSFPNACAMH
jgi:hypothetical protein